MKISNDHSEIELDDGVKLIAHSRGSDCTGCYLSKNRYELCRKIKPNCHGEDRHDGKDRMFIIRQDAAIFEGIDAVAGRENALKSWLFSTDTGSSSRFMACVLSGWSIPLPSNDYPRDPSDLGRCIRLIESVPEFKGCIHKMNAHGSEWQQVVLHWEQWSELYKTDQNKLFNQMKLAYGK